MSGTLWTWHCWLIICLMHMAMQVQSFMRWSNKLVRRGTTWRPNSALIEVPISSTSTTTYYGFNNSRSVIHTVRLTPRCPHALCSLVLCPRLTASLLARRESLPPPPPRGRVLATGKACLHDLAGIRRG